MMKGMAGGGCGCPGMRVAGMGKLAALPGPASSSAALEAMWADGVDGGLADLLRRGVGGPRPAGPEWAAGPSRRRPGRGRQGGRRGKKKKKGGRVTPPKGR